MADPTVMTVVDILGPFAAIVADAADFTFTPLTLTDGDVFRCTGREILLVYNPSGGALTITITSVDDEYGRAEDITTYSVGAGEWSVFGVGLTNQKGWKNASGNIRITGSSADLDAVVLRLPEGLGR